MQPTLPKRTNKSLAPTNDQIIAAARTADCGYHSDRSKWTAEGPYVCTAVVEYVALKVARLVQW